MLLKVMFAIMFPMIMMTFIFTGKARKNTMFLLIGLAVAVAAAYINALFGALPFSGKYYSSNIGPIVEELVKAIPVLIYAFVKKPNRQDLLESGLSVGVGFAIIENAYYMARYPEKITVFAALFRGIGAGMMHGITAMAVGFGISLILTKKKLFLTGTLTFMSMAMTYHSIYNMLVQSKYQLLGFAMPIITFTAFLIFYLRYTKYQEPNEENQKKFSTKSTEAKI